jgi:hypothetical protein
VYKAELSDRTDSETPAHADYVLHRTGCSQEDDYFTAPRPSTSSPESGATSPGLRVPINSPVTEGTLTETIENSMGVLFKSQTAPTKVSYLRHFRNGMPTLPLHYQSLSLKKLFGSHVVFGNGQFHMFARQQAAVSVAALLNRFLSS